MARGGLAAAVVAAFFPAAAFAQARQASPTLVSAAHASGALGIARFPAPAGGWISSLQDLSLSASFTSPLAFHPIVEGLTRSGVSLDRFSGETKARREELAASGLTLVRGEMTRTAASVLARLAATDPAALDEPRLKELRDDLKYLSDAFGPHLEGDLGRQVGAGYRAFHRAVEERSLDTARDWIAAFARSRPSGVDLAGASAGPRAAGRLSPYALQPAAPPSPVPAPKSATIDGVRTRYVHAGQEHAGTRLPLLLVHGFCGSVYSWRNVIADLAKTREVIAVDLPGFGLADKPRDFDYRLQGLSDWLLAFLDHLEIEKAHWVGSSMGGVLSLLATLKAPERVERLALIGPVAFVEDQIPGAWRFTTPLVGRVTERVLGLISLRPILKGIYVDPAKVTDEAVAEYERPFKSKGGRHAAAEVVRRAMAPEAVAMIRRYPEIRSETLILAGEFDKRVKLSSFMKLKKNLPNARLRLLFGAGHVPHEDTPELVLPELQDFFDEPDAG
ncbi:MAG: alpha/beta fold hydrolase [Proteobacteria bacterium]|nr:alpha/beta fold hydrolase [Pseudomonadota bacterium]